MSDTEKKESGTSSLLEELLVIRDALDEVDAHEAGTSEADPAEPAEMPAMPSQIPLLQDVIEVETPAGGIQPASDVKDPWLLADQDAPFGFDRFDGFASDDNLSEPAFDPSVPEAELSLLEEDSGREIHAQDEDTSVYTEYQTLLPLDDAAPMRTGVTTGISADISDELIDSLIEEHVDEILELFRKILRDKLSLMLAQIKDTNDIAHQPGNQAVDVPEADPEDWEAEDRDSDP